MKRDRERESSYFQEFSFLFFFRGFILQSKSIIQSRPYKSQLLCEEKYIKIIPVFVTFATCFLSILNFFRMSKQILRTAIKSKLKSLTKKQKVQATQILKDKILAHPKLKSANSIGVYVSSERLNEIGTHEVIETFLQEVFD